MKRLFAIGYALLVSIALLAQEKNMKAYMVADAHLDTQWNWDVQTTIHHHIRNTLTQNLFLLKQYPDYSFTDDCYKKALKRGLYVIYVM